MSAGGSKKVIIISLIANLCIAISKLAGAIFTASAALMAEAVHSFADCGNQILLLYGQKAASKGVSEKYPLGRGKEGFFWSFVVALLLFSMGGLFSIYEGVHKIQHPEPLQHAYVAIIILIIAMVLESISFYACFKEVKKENRFGSMREWIKKTTRADLLVIFLEDFAALLGLSMALIALIMFWITGNTLWDGLGSFLIGILLVVVAVVLAREIKSLLIGESPAFDYKGEIGKLVLQEIPSAHLVNLIALQSGVGEVMVSYKIHPGDISEAKDLIEAINRLETKVKEKFPEIKWQFAEPDYHN